MLILFFAIVACRKNNFITNTDAVIHFSSDTLLFDTVFTATGSVTQSVKIINGNHAKLKLSDIRLAGGNSSSFKINIDGAATNDAQNVSLDADDSLYVFVSVLINPSNANLPFIISDSIEVTFNGNTRYIQLQAFGQNAHFLRNFEIASDQVWTNDLPYVILGGLQVNSNASLTIQKGCRIYSHADAPFVVDGTLITSGDSLGRVYFASDRMDLPYKNFPGSWPGIVFRQSSKGNQLLFTVIENAYQGVVLVGESGDANPKLTLDNCIIDNIYDAGILSTQSSFVARNCLISNSGKNVVINYGGNYSLSYCTVASYGNDYISHINPVLTITDYFPGNTASTASLSAVFTNCIFWGSVGTVTDEVQTDLHGGASTIQVNHGLWREPDNPSGVMAVNMLNNDPMFDSINNQNRIYDFHLKPQSPGIGLGIVLPGIPFDLDGKPRIVAGKTDVGCYQLQ